MCVSWTPQALLNLNKLTVEVNQHNQSSQGNRKALVGPPRLPGVAKAKRGPETHGWDQAWPGELCSVAERCQSVMDEVDRSSQDRFVRTSPVPAPSETSAGSHAQFGKTTTQSILKGLERSQ